MDKGYKASCRNIAAFQIKHSLKVGTTGTTSSFLECMTSFASVDDEMLLYFHRCFVRLAEINGYRLNFQKHHEGQPVWAIPFTAEKMKRTQHLRIMCPRCGQSNAVEYIYGSPIPDAIQMAKRGDAILCGCCVPSNAPEYLCKCCHQKFGHPPYFDSQFSAENQAFHTLVPEFSFESGGYFGPCFNLKMKYDEGFYIVKVAVRNLGDSIVYREPHIQVVRDEEGISYHITEKCFEKFIRDLYEKTFLADWKHNYIDPYVRDGGGAEIIIGKTKYEILNEWPPYYKKLCNMVSRWFRRAGYTNIHVF